MISANLEALGAYCGDLLALWAFTARSADFRSPQRLPACSLGRCRAGLPASVVATACTDTAPFQVRAASAPGLGMSRCVSLVATRSQGRVWRAGIPGPWRPSWLPGGPRAALPGPDGVGGLWLFIPKEAAVGWGPPTNGANALFRQGSLGFHPVGVFDLA